MQSLLEQIRKKPEAIRARYLFTTVGIAFLFVGTIWVFSLKASFATILESDAPDTVMRTVGEKAGSAPVSLEDMMKAGEILREQSDHSPRTPSPDNTSNLLPDTKMPAKSPATPAPPAATETAPSITTPETPGE